MVDHRGKRQEANKDACDPSNGLSFLFRLTQLIDVQFRASRGHSRDGSTDDAHGKLLTDMNRSNSITLKKKKLKVETLGPFKILVLLRRRAFNGITFCVPFAQSTRDAGGIEACRK